MNSPLTQPFPFYALLPAFRALCDVVGKLRGSDGCLWNRRQTLEAIKPHTLEVICELFDTIHAGDGDLIVESVGDVLSHVVLDAQIGAYEGNFGLIGVGEGITH